jgi:hypothetical protein
MPTQKVQVELFPLSLKIVRHVASRNQQSEKTDKPPVCSAALWMTQQS